MTSVNIEKWFGLAGVTAWESLRAQWWWRCFRHATSMVVLLLAIQWQMGVKGTLTPTLDTTFNWIVWLFFVMEFFILLLLVRNKQKFVLQNFTLVLVVMAGIPLVLSYMPLVHLLRSMRPLLVMILLIPWIDICRASLMDNKLGTTLLSAFIITILAGVFISGFDPGIPTLRDGIWWAWVSVTTVGYGDIVPVSGLGRIFGALLILMGLLLFTVLIANFSAIFVGREEQKARRERKEIYRILKGIEKVKADEDAILHALKNIQGRMEKLERE